MTTNNKSYIHRGGDAGAERLKVLTNATWPNTRAFLLRAGLKPGMRVLDVGCGGGDLTLRIAEMLAPKGSIIGIDYDARKIEIAAQLTEQTDYTVEFRQHDITADTVIDETKFDFVFARFLLWTLKDPDAALNTLVSYLHPGGILALEDIDGRGQYCYPQCKGFEKYAEFHEKAAEHMGSNSHLGIRLFYMMTKADLKQVQLHMEHPVFSSGDGKKIPLLTMQAIQPSVLELGLATSTEMSDYLTELEKYTADLSTIITLPCFYQVSGIV